MTGSHSKLMLNFSQNPSSCLLYSVVVNPSASRAELMMMTVSDIVSQLITAHEKGNDVNLNKLVPDIC